MPRRWSDEQVEQAIGTLLRAGVLLAAAVVLLGGTLFLRHQGSQVADYRVFLGEPPALRTAPGILTAALSGRGRGLIQLGLLVLIATPIARVAFALVAFVLQRDRLYTTVTAVVLAVLAFSLFANPA
jgi:uncharacterized membrane protein